MGTVLYSEVRAPSVAGLGKNHRTCLPGAHSCCVPLGSPQGLSLQGSDCGNLQPQLGMVTSVGRNEMES